MLKVYLVPQVGEIRSVVEDPVLECVTREETVCHTTYITQYTPVKVRLLGPSTSNSFTTLGLS